MRTGLPGIFHNQDEGHEIKAQRGQCEQCRQLSLRMKNKKAQIAYFLIFGIIILIAIGFLLNIDDFQKDRYVEKTSEAAFDSQSVKNFIGNCLDETTKDGIYFITLQGGYYDMPDLSESIANVNIPYYWYYNESLIPGKELIELELSKYIKKQMPDCINNFNSFKEIGYKIDSKEISVKTNIALNDVNFEVNYPVHISYGSSEAYIEKFTINSQINFNKKYTIVKQIIEEQEKNPDFIPAGFISDLSFENNFTFANIYLDENSVLYTLIFNEWYNREPIIYSFLAEYNWNTSENVELKKIENLTAYPDYTFKHKVNLTGENLKFSDYTDLFDINESTGLIDFTPSFKDVGNHLIMIKGYSEQGNEVSEILWLNIIGENKPPIIEEIKDIEIYVGEELNLTVKASDPENETIFYVLTSNLTNLKINPISGEFSFKPSSEQKGAYTIGVGAIDLIGNMDETSFNMEINGD